MSEEEIQHICIRPSEIKEVLESTPIEEKSAKIRSFLDRAGDCPYCRQIVHKAINPNVS